jgi:hypothetical protein
VESPCAGITQIRFFRSEPFETPSQPGLTELPYQDKDSAPAEYRGAQAGPKARTVLWPPKPNELERVGPGVHSLGSRTMSVSGISGS